MRLQQSHSNSNGAMHTYTNECRRTPASATAATGEWQRLRVRSSVEPRALRDTSHAAVLPPPSATPPHATTPNSTQPSVQVKLLLRKAARRSFNYCCTTTTSTGCPSWDAAACAAPAPPKLKLRRSGVVSPAPPSLSPLHCPRCYVRASRLRCRPRTRKTCRGAPLPRCPRPCEVEVAHRQGGRRGRAHPTKLKLGAGRTRTRSKLRRRPAGAAWTVQSSSLIQVDVRRPPGTAQRRR